MEIPHNSMILVADGEKMLFFRNEGDAEYPRLVVERQREQDNPKDAAQKTDEPGRTFSSAGTGAGRSAYEETDFHQLAKERFAGDAADMLKRWALRGDIENLIVVAPPATLGELRKHYHKEVEKRVSGELAKDLTNMPVDQIEKALQDA